jgi:hypothetical protein
MVGSSSSQIAAYIDNQTTLNQATIDEIDQMQSIIYANISIGNYQTNSINWFNNMTQYLKFMTTQVGYQRLGFYYFFEIGKFSRPDLFQK